MLALTIETCLLKLSLLRAKTHNAVYNHPSPNNSGKAVAQALANYHQRLQTKDKEQREEEALLDAQLREYDNLMELVGGKGRGGFSQIVEDMLRARNLGLLLLLLSPQRCH